MNGFHSEYQKGVFATVGHVMDVEKGEFEFEPDIVTTAELSGRDDAYLVELAASRQIICVSRQFVRGIIAAEKVMWNHRACSSEE